jgi:phosphoglycolate phosphatase-like HAD superfamily hydrolase
MQTQLTDQQMFAAASFNGWAEVGPGLAPRHRISHVVFDFDGTLSWLRHGWPEIMARLFREHVRPLPGESEEVLHELLLQELLALNGKPSIHQMERCAELARARGGNSPAPEALLKEYHRRLDTAIEARTQSIQNGSRKRDDFIVHGARPVLEALHARRLQLFILSGTEQSRVRQEADLLDLTRYFGNHIYGSMPGSEPFSKHNTMRQLMLGERAEGKDWLSFGDGPVEIRLAKEVGALAVGIASDENQNGSGQPDKLKLSQLREAGADVLVPDYRDASALFHHLLGTPGQFL